MSWRYAVVLLRLPSSISFWVGTCGRESARLGVRMPTWDATVVAKTSMKMLTLATYDVDRMKKKAPEMLDKLKAVIEERSGGS